MRKTVIGLLTVGLLFGFGCGSDDPEDPVLPKCEGFKILKGDGSGTAGTVRIGFLAPVTGDSSKFGIEQQNGVELAYRAINYVIKDYNIEIVVIDSESDSKGSGIAKKNYTKAIEECGLSAGLLNWHSGVAVDVMDVAADNKLPHFFTMGATDAVNEKFKRDPAKFSPWGTKAWPQPAVYVKGYTDALQKLVESGNWAPENKVILLGHEAGAWGKSFVRGARDLVTKDGSYWKTNGWKVLDDTIQIGDKAEFAGFATKAAADKVSLVITTSTADDAWEFAVAMRDALPEAMIVLEGLGWSPDGPKSAGDKAVMILDGGGAPGFRDNAAADTFLAEFKKAFADKPEPNTSAGGMAYDFARYSIKVFEATVDKHSKLDKESIQDVNANEVQKNKIKFTDGVVMKEYSYSEKWVPDMNYGEDQYYFPIFQYQAEAGKDPEQKIVHPASLAGDNKLLYPEPAAPATP